jgi:hypothetical protein
MTPSAAGTAPDGCRPVAADVCSNLAAIAKGRTRTRRYVALFLVNGSGVGADDGRVARALEALPAEAMSLLRAALTPADGEPEQWLVFDTHSGDCWACPAEAGLEFVTRRNRP